MNKRPNRDLNPCWLDCLDSALSSAPHLPHPLTPSSAPGAGSVIVQLCLPLGREGAGQSASAQSKPQIPPCPSPGDHLGRQPIKSKSIKQTPCWLLPSFSDLSEEAHIPGQPTCIREQIREGTAGSGIRAQNSALGACDVGLYNLIPIGEGEVGDTL